MRCEPIKSPGWAAAARWSGSIGAPERSPARAAGRAPGFESIVVRPFSFARPHKVCWARLAQIAVHSTVRCPPCVQRHGQVGGGGAFALAGAADDTPTRGARGPRSKTSGWCAARGTPRQPASAGRTALSGSDQASWGALTSAHRRQGSRRAPAVRGTARYPPGGAPRWTPGIPARRPPRRNQHAKQASGQRVDPVRGLCCRSRYVEHDRLDPVLAVEGGFCSSHTLEQQTQP